MINKPVPYLVAINLTERCNLNCAHCYMDAVQRKSPSDNELTTGELRSLFSKIAQRAPGTIIVITGGEPLMHPDINEIISSGSNFGLRMVLGTNGTLLTEDSLVRLKDAGLEGIGVSLDAVNEEQHNSFRGVRGAFKKSCDAIKLCKKHDMHAQIHFTVTKHNYGQLEKIVSLGKDLGASIINFFFLVCLGRGRSILDLSMNLYEKTLKKIAILQKESSEIMLQSRCAPHFKRILYENNPESPYTRATGYDGGGCPAATHYCRITPQGEMTPCPYIELSAGNIREKSFWELWDNTPLFTSLRNLSLLEGRCSFCEYKLLCGGCRARSLVHSGNLMGEDPNCNYVPHRGEIIATQTAMFSKNVEWTPQAKERIKKIPLFLRNRVGQKLEERAMREGLPVTVALMKKYREERERELGIKFN